MSYNVMFHSTVLAHSRARCVCVYWDGKLVVRASRTCTNQGMHTLMCSSNKQWSTQVSPSFAQTQRPHSDMHGGWFVLGDLISIRTAASVLNVGF